MNYYNEWDKHAAQWLRNLIAARLIPAGDVDERDIRTVKPEDLKGYRQCHFFAGIGGWSMALQLAEWPDERAVWTGSCPCQPFSVAGSRKAKRDHRHLWPDFARLIQARRPPTVFGEQVASPDGYDWLLGVRGDLEMGGYDFGAADIPVCAIGAPHKRERLYWVADAKDGHGWRGERRAEEGAGQNGLGRGRPPGGGKTHELADANREGCRLRSTKINHHGDHASGYVIGGCGEARGLGNADRSGLEGYVGDEKGGNKSGRDDPSTDGHPAAASIWDDYVIVECVENGERILRRSQPGLVGVVDGLPFRLADGRTLSEASRRKLIEGFGNAIVPQVAAEFVRAYMETRV